MYVIIVGGGNIGSYLAHLLLDAGHRVKIIEERPELLEKLKKEVPPDAVIVGDGSSPLTLERADISRANVLVAVTGADDSNLVVTSLARFEFNVPRRDCKNQQSKERLALHAGNGRGHCPESSQYFSAACDGGNVAW